MGLYHKDVYMTRDMIKQCPSLYCGELEETEHFLNRSKSFVDKYSFDKGLLDDTIKNIQSEKPDPFEIATDDKGNVTKCCIRVPFDDYRDLCVVFAKNRIVTCWFNSNSDNHITLDESKYDRT